MSKPKKQSDVDRRAKKAARIVSEYMEENGDTPTDRYVADKLDVSPRTVRNYKKRDAFKNAMYEHTKGYLPVYANEALETMKRNMNCGDPKVEVKAAKEIAKMAGLYDREHIGKDAANQLNLVVMGSNEEAKEAVANSDGDGPMLNIQEDGES